MSLIRFLKDENGATAIEYALVAALVALAGIIAYTALGDTISSSYANITNGFCTVIGGTFELTGTGSGSCIF